MDGWAPIGNSSFIAIRFGQSTRGRETFQLKPRTIAINLLQFSHFPPPSSCSTFVQPPLPPTHTLFPLSIVPFLCKCLWFAPFSKLDAESWNSCSWLHIKGSRRIIINKLLRRRIRRVECQLSSGQSNNKSLIVAICFLSFPLQGGRGIEMNNLNEPKLSREERRYSVPHGPHTPMPPPASEDLHAWSIYR